MVILDRIDRELPSLERLELKFGLSSEFFNKIPVRILVDVPFRVFRFFKAAFYVLASSFMTFWNFVAFLTLKRTEGCNGNFVISRVKLQIIAEISHQNQGVFRHLWCDYIHGWYSKPARSWSLNWFAIYPERCIWNNEYSAIIEAKVDNILQDLHNSYESRIQ